MEEVWLKKVQGEVTEGLDCPLAMEKPLPLTHHPAAVYLSQLAPRSRRTMRQALNSLAAYLTQGQCDAFTRLLVKTPLSSHRCSTVNFNGKVFSCDSLLAIY